MKRHWIISIIAINLAALIALVFVFPQHMISPGPVMPAHADFGNDCFACHAPLRGAAPERCQACHIVAEIGRFTSKGEVIPAPGRKVAFHQHLREQNCLACHSDHAGPKLTGHGQKPFSHALLTADMRTQCASCHARPANNLHKRVAAECGQCHSTNAWEPAAFKHEFLAMPARTQCETCHAKPKDGFHEGIQGDCQQCHRTSAWKPSTFNHDRYFVLDGDHNAPCATCHVKNNLKQYTCYGCHEHTPANIRAEHLEEGIRDFRNCVRCHRSADDEGGERRGGGDED